MKAAAYGGLAICVLWFGYGFFASYARVTDASPEPPATHSAAVRPEAATPDKAGSFHTRRTSRMLVYGAGAIAALVGLGLLSAHDLSHFLANRVEAFIFDDQGEAMPRPEYDHAEEVWKAGKPLEAVQLMRDYLKEHPREQYVALRIAEIYEKDLGNHVAAALEYEEILKKPLPHERWGWAAIHLANLYSGKLNKIEQAEALLHRIINEHGHTAAARKARQRLGLPDPEPAPEPESVEDPEAPSEPVRPPPSASHLPPGFRPKND
ncbi:MAG: hypothetical protein JXQ71_17235 [Verrucomicrobia bacterium]|nr:hypothetical protein [Verrucomicrobiota bacterium]